MLLADKTTPSANLSLGSVVLTYLAPQEMSVYARIDLGSALHPIVGGSYTLRFQVNGVTVNPDSLVSVVGPLGVCQSRPLLLHAGDKLTIIVIGLAADTVVDIRATLASDLLDPDTMAADILATLSPAINSLIISTMQSVQLQPEVHVLGPCSQPLTAVPKLARPSW